MLTSLYILIAIGFYLAQTPMFSRGERLIIAVLWPLAVAGLILEGILKVGEDLWG